MKRIISTLGNLAFHAFLAAYWYLDTNLQPDYALIGTIAVYLLYVVLLPRVPNVVPQPALLALSGLLFFLMLSPLPNLRGLSLLIWVTAAATLFRLSFALLQRMSFRAGALLASYVLFLALPLGMPRITSESPSSAGGEPLDVAIVGAGFGGMAMAKELLDAGMTNFRVFEAAPEVGGTWWHNRYPGLHVDVQSALYSYSFFPNPNWSRLWAPRDELLQYSVDASHALGVRPFIQFNTWVQGLRFDDDTGLWQVSLGERSVQARHLVLATGGLHIPKTPAFEGAEDYAGQSFHSARWRDDIPLEQQRVAIIGSGASAVQILPQIAKVAQQVDMYQRTPNWISPQDNRAVSSLQQLVYAYVPLAYKLRRLRTHVYSELGFRAVFPLKSERRAQVEEALSSYIRTTIDDEALESKLIPDYEFGCKRPLVTGYFYPSLNRDNVEVITEGIDRFTPAGILSQTGNERDYDVIIMATGYRVAGLPFPIEGRQGQSLETLWRDKPQAYKTMMVHGFPNLYLMSGPNSGLIGSIIIHIESAARYMMQVIDKAGDDQFIEPSLAAQQAFNRDIQAGLSETVWAGSCKSWYKLEDGHVIANHPDPISTIVYNRARPRWQDFSIQARN